MSTLEQQITAEYFDAPALPFYLPEDADPDSVPSLHFPIGRLIVEPGVLAQAMTEIGQFPHSGGIGNSTESGIQFDEEEIEPSPWLKDFLAVTVQKFGTVVDRYSHTHYPQREGRIYIKSLTAGPYEYSDENAWHRDSVEVEAEQIACVTSFGPTTRFANGSFYEGDYDDSAQGLFGELFTNVSCLTDTYSYPPGIISVHHGVFTVHSAPGRVHDGEARLFLDHREYKSGLFTSED